MHLEGQICSEPFLSRLQLSELDRHRLQRFWWRCYWQTWRQPAPGCCHMLKIGAWLPSLDSKRYDFELHSPRIQKLWFDRPNVMWTVRPGRGHDCLLTVGTRAEEHTRFAGPRCHRMPQMWWHFPRGRSRAFPVVSCLDWSQLSETAGGIRLQIMGWEGKP